MIGKDFFNDNFQEQAELYGWRITDKRARKIYFTLNEQSFTEQELSIALEWYEKDEFRFADFLSVIRRARADRIEREAVENQRREEWEVKEWFRTHAGSRDTCINAYNCGACKRIYCDIGTKAVIGAIKEILSGETESKVIMQGLATKFKGVGFEQQAGIEPF